MPEHRAVRAALDLVEAKLLRDDDRQVEQAGGSHEEQVGQAAVKRTVNRGCQFAGRLPRSGGFLPGRLRARVSDAHWNFEPPFTRQRLGRSRFSGVVRRLVSAPCPWLRDQTLNNAALD
jgi:hypothetical protein